MFVTMSCFSESSMLLSCKKRNDTAATSSLLLTTNWDYLFFWHNYTQLFLILRIIDYDKELTKILAKDLPNGP